jgi:mxaJ protein
MTVRFAAVAALVLCAAAAPAAAQDKAPERKALRVCQDPNNLPFSNTKGEGIENRIADVFGKALGLPVTYYSFPQRLAFIRNTLRYKLPGEDFRCDIVMSVPYALVFAKGKGLDDVKSSADFLALGKDRLAKLRIGIYDRSPASEWLTKHGLIESGVPYQTMNADPEQYPGDIIEKDLAAGKLDVAIVWGPIAGFFAKRVKTPALAVVPMKSEPGVRFDFQMAMGVRHGEREWKQQVETLLESKQTEIRAILDEFGVPVVDESFSAQGR